MEQILQKEVSEYVKDFKLPKYDEIPNVGLFLEQTAKYISEYLEPLGFSLTGSMISNYVKKKLVANPVKKQYDREQIAYLFFIAVAKSVMSLEDIQLIINLQKKTYAGKVAYDYFCTEFENVLFYVFGLKESLDAVGSTQTDEKIILRNIIIAVAHKVYLDKCVIKLSRDMEHELENEKI